MTHGEIDPSCAVAHDAVAQDAAPSADAIAHGAPGPAAPRVLVAVFDSPVAGYLLRYGADCGYQAVLLEPDADRAAAAAGRPGQVVIRDASGLDPTADVVVTDHHRPELDQTVRDLLGSKARWIGVMGNPRHPAPYLPGLTAMGVPAGEIARVHRPIGLNIGSRTPPEIALSTLAGLIADRNGRPGGFSF